MNLIRFSIEKPVTVLVGVILIVMFGVIGLYRMPYQLSPTVIEPVITVTTTWRGATPYEVEREIIEEQEKVLKGIPNLIELESTSYNGRGDVTLRFSIGTNIDDALLRVSNKLNEVKSYPANVDRPVITATGAATSPVIWMILRTVEGNPRNVATYQTYFENEIRQHLERVEGVADLFIGGGQEEEIHVVIDPVRLAGFGLTIDDVTRVLVTENANVSAGNLGVGRRDFRIRTTGEFTSVEEIENVVLVSTGQKRVFMKDVATVRRGFEKKTTTMLHNGQSGIAVGVKPEPGTNVLAMTDRVKEVVDRLNEEKLNPRGIYFDWVYDQRFYIRSAIDLIRQNILLGGGFAVCVLLIFLRSVRSTLAVATSIPISVIGTFIFMHGFGRNLNVVSLSGIAFAVGMLVDNAIVVIENIDRHRQMGKTPFQAAYDGTSEVWGAVLASTLTTIAVFLPVVFLQEEAGQLFRDIALAVVAAVALSLVTSVTVIPMLTNAFFSFSARKEARTGKHKAQKKGKNILVRTIVGIVRLAISTWPMRVITISVLTAASIFGAYALLPKTEYLPQGNRNLVLTILVQPPGLSVEERQEIGEHIFTSIEPYFRKEKDGLPGIKQIFFVGRESLMLFGALSTDPERAGDLVPLFSRTVFTIPGMFGVSLQPGIFETRIGSGRTIDLDIAGDDLSSIVRTAGMMFVKIRGVMPSSQIRPLPSFEMTYPEVRFQPLRDRIRANGMSAQALGEAVDVLMDGREITEFKEPGKKKIDLVLMTAEERVATPEDLFESLVVTPRGGAVPVSSLATLERTQGIPQIRHLERSRTITLQVTPPGNVPLEEAMEIVDSKVVNEMRAAGMLKGINVSMSGAAEKLTETRQALQWNFILAALISYLLMSALFGNFLYPFIIMFTVPLAGAGGFMGLWLLNLHVTQPMDILTMLGFVILIGVVVNNAILIVHQALNNVRLHAMEPLEAVLESVRVRLRPIYMSACTSIFGMLPLVLFPGSGSELYRGLGAVILGGLAVSTFFTVFVIPALLMFVIRMEKPNPSANTDS